LFLLSHNDYIYVNFGYFLLKESHNINLVDSTNIYLDVKKTKMKGKTGKIRGKSPIDVIKYIIFKERLISKIYLYHEGYIYYG